MKYLQSFKDKIKEFEEVQLKAGKLKVELREDVKDIIRLIVEILDDMTIDNDTKTFNVNINSDVKIYKITNNKTYDNEREIYLHLNGINTIIYWEDKISTKKDSLWNFNAGGQEDYKIFADILSYLIDNYKDSYDNVIEKRSAKKYNL